MKNDKEMKRKSEEDREIIRKTRLSHLYFFILFIFSFLLGCTEPFYIDTDDADPVLVVYGVLTSRYERQFIRLTRSAPYFDKNPTQPVSGARVTINSSDNKFYELKEDTHYPGYYLSERFWSAKAGVTYSLNVEVDFHENGIVEIYEATTTIEDMVYLDSIKIVPIRIMGHENYALNIYGQDSPEEDYYLFHVAVNDSLVTNKLSNYIISDDALYNGEYIPGLTIEYFDHISEWENDSEEDRRKSIYLQSGDLITVFPAKIEKGYYDFLSQCNREKNGENPMFGGPASNISTNITNGAVGFFTGYCSTSVITWVE